MNLIVRMTKRSEIRVGEFRFFSPELAPYHSQKVVVALPEGLLPKELPVFVEDHGELLPLCSATRTCSGKEWFSPRTKPDHSFASTSTPQPLDNAIPGLVPLTPKTCIRHSPRQINMCRTEGNSYSAQK